MTGADRVKRGFNRIALVGAVPLLVAAAFHFINYFNNASLFPRYASEIFDKGMWCLFVGIV